MAAFSKRGGMNESYCSEDCYSKAGTLVTAMCMKQSRGACMYCGEVVAPWQGPGVSGIGFAHQDKPAYCCKDCVSQLTELTKDEGKCFACGKPLHATEVARPLGEQSAIFSQCPSCGKQIRVTTNLIGKKGKCPKCSTIFRITASSNAPDQSGSAAIVEEKSPAAANDTATGTPLQRLVHPYTGHVEEEHIALAFWQPIKSYWPGVLREFFGMFLVGGNSQHFGSLHDIGCAVVSDAKLHLVAIAEQRGSKILFDGQTLKTLLEQDVKPKCESLSLSDVVIEKSFAAVGEALKITGVAELFLYPANRSNGFPKAFLSALPIAATT
jgi:hypothetical protein